MNGLATLKKRSYIDSSKIAIAGAAVTDLIDDYGAYANRPNMNKGDE